MSTEVVATRDRAQPVQVGVRRVAIIGAGSLGRRLAELCCQAGFSIILEDVLPSRLRGAARAFSSAIGSLGQVEFAGTIEEAVRAADLVIDCVPDELESKLEILSLIDRMAPPRTIIATPTRSLSIADLASCTYRPERCLGLQLPSGMLGAGESAIATAEECDSEATIGPEGKSAIENLVGITTTGRSDPTVVEHVVQFWRRLGFEADVTLDPQAASYR